MNGYPEKDITPKEGVALQRRLAEKVLREDRPGSIERVCGVDISARGGMGRAGCVVMDYPDLTLVETTTFSRRLTFPYVPGLLSFREIPVLLPAIGKLSRRPDLFLVDGQGIAHPRRMGLASHLGVLTGVRTIGCAKSRLTGTFSDPGLERGSTSPLYEGNEMIGIVLRTREGVKPVFVSIGHGVSLETAVDVVLGCCTRYRLPEPIRCAHMIAGGQALPRRYL
jgi:deoxyribonuclease V